MVPVATVLRLLKVGQGEGLESGSSKNQSQRQDSRSSPAEGMPSLEDLVEIKGELIRSTVRLPLELLDLMTS